MSRGDVFIIRKNYKKISWYTKTSQKGVKYVRIWGHQELSNSTSAITLFQAIKIWKITTLPKP